MLETANDLIVNKKIPALGPVQMLAHLQYVFTPNNVSVRTRIPEIEYRHAWGHPKAVKPFLPSTLSIAHRPVTSVREVNQ